MTTDDVYSHEQRHADDAEWSAAQPEGDLMDYPPCQRCGGAGVIRDRRRDAEGIPWGALYWRECALCEGSGTGHRPKGA